MDRYATFPLHLEFYLKHKMAFKELMLNSSRSDALYYCNRLLIESHLNFDKTLRYLLYGKIFQFCVAFGFFL